MSSPDNSTNSTNSSNNGGGGGGVSNETVVAIVALVISVIALLGTILQVLQQYFASATGFTNCDPKVIGQWSQGVARKFRYHELRFEVQFDTPVIFVTPVSNKNRGPIAGQTNIFITGTPESHKETKTEPLNGGDKGDGQNTKPAANGISILGKSGLRQRSTFQTVRATHKERQSQREGIHTADNERATWVTLLSHLQNMESQSEEWQQSQYADNGPPPGAIPTFEDRKLAVAIQTKRKSWDTMPDSVKKPYATTTMCHIIEIAAMMGLHWKIFDRIRDIYRAEGNGYILSGHEANDLGIMFTFQVCGKSKFHASRIIPADEVKELSFGFVSTLFRKHDDTDNRRLEFPTEEPRDLGILQLGSPNEIAETLVSFGCNTNSAKYLRDDKKKHGHLFPLAFEMTGMLGRKLHIRNTFFRMLPNPTFYHWDKKFFSLRRLLTAFKNMIDSELIAHSTLHIQELKSQAGIVVESIRRARKVKGENGFDLKLFGALDDAIDFCDEFLTSDAAGGRNNLKIVEVVLREHFQLVLHMVNEEEAPETPGQDIHSVATSRHEIPSFEDLNAASPEQKQEKFMDIYFSSVLPQVAKRCTRTLRHAARTFLGPPDIRGATRPPPVARTPTPTPGLPVVQDENGPVNMDQTSSSASSSAAADEDAEIMNNSNYISASEDEITDIWCTLVFRMLCWLLLHDFHKNDIQMGKSEQWGSRLPVYIA